MDTFTLLLKSAAEIKRLAAWNDPDKDASSPARLRHSPESSTACWSAGTPS